MKPWLLKRWRRHVALIVVGTLAEEYGASHRLVRILMGRPDGLLFGGWFYWVSGYGILIRFSEANQMTGWDALFGVKESALAPYPPA
jgi:hypothetical protein